MGPSATGWILAWAAKRAGCPIEREARTRAVRLSGLLSGIDRDRSDLPAERTLMLPSALLDC